MRLAVAVGCAYVLCVAATLASIVWMRRVLSGARSMSDGASLARYKRLARVEMHLRLVVGGLLVAGFFGCVALIGRGGWVGLGTLAAGNLSVYAFGLWHRRVEAQVRNQGAVSEAYRSEYERVSEAWAKKLIPDF